MQESLSKCTIGRVPWLASCALQYPHEELGIHHHSDFKYKSDLILMISHYSLKKNLLPEVSWLHCSKTSSCACINENSWRHTTLLESSFMKEAVKAQGMAVEQIIEMVTHKTIYPEIRLQLYFIKEYCQRLMPVLTSLQANLPLACTVYNTPEGLRLYLCAGTMKTSFREDNCPTWIKEGTD